MTDNIEISVVTALILNPIDVMGKFENPRFLIIKRKSADSIHPGLWALPGGKVKKHESLILALIREIKEETGHKIIEDEIKEKLSTYSYLQPDGTNVHGICYKVVPNTKDYILSSGHDVERIKWVTIEELENLPHVKGIIDEAMKGIFG